MPLSFHFVVGLGLVYGTSFVFRFLERYQFPILAVEILAGIVFGSILGVVGQGSPGYGFILHLAAFGLLMVMFDAGLELNPEVIRRNPRQVGTLAAFTFVLPFLAGVGLAFFLGLSMFAAFLVGVTVSTTSLGLIYPMLEDFDFLESDTGQLILSVTVMNDILSVAALAYGITLITAPRPVVGIGLVTAALGFFFVLLPFYLDDYIDSVWVREDLFANSVKFGVFLMIALAFVMEQIGVHAILGAFFAGLVLSIVTDEGHRIEKLLTPVTNLTAPVFFFYVGMNVDLSGFQSSGAIILVAVILIGIGTKLVGGLLGSWATGLDGRTTALLTSAIPGRLSISVAAAEIGRSRGIISPELYNAFVVLSVVSVFVSVIAFRFFAGNEQSSLVPSLPDIS
jgi:Kef-type K+ transport system membrane component KefB